MFIGNGDLAFFFLTHRTRVQCPQLPPHITTQL
jgi:hypothetical protein